MQQIPDIFPSNVFLFYDDEWIAYISYGLNEWTPSNCGKYKLELEHQILLGKFINRWVLELHNTHNYFIFRDIMYEEL